MVGGLAASIAEASDLPEIFGNSPRFSRRNSDLACIPLVRTTVTITELIAEQRRRARSGNPAERFAAALLIPAEVSRRLRLLSDSQIGQLLDNEVCPNISILAPEATVCAEAAHRLRGTINKARCARRLRARMPEDGEHILHAESALYRAGIPFLQLPWQMNRFASSTFLVSEVADAEVCLLQAGFRKTSCSPSSLIDGQTGRPIHLYEDRTRLNSSTKEGLDE
jgi:hypothetical protein